MTGAKLAATAITVKAQTPTTKTGDSKATKKTGAEDYEFRATGQLLIFPGYLKIWPEKTQEQALPVVKEAQNLRLLALKSERHETNPPARYSDASLVKELEKYGIGRPSTYAPTIATIILRNYVERAEQKRLKPTAIAFIVIDLLVKHFPKIVDYAFTAKLEDDLDEIALGKQAWQPIISNFYEDFHANLENKYQEIKKSEIMPEEKSNEVCDKCGAAMIIKTGRYGKFLACSAFPECRNIKKLAGAPGADKSEDPGLKDLQQKYAGTVCDKCGAAMAVKTGKFGPFLACSAYPKCKNIKNITVNNGPEISCPICGDGKIIKKFSRRGAFWACSNYPACKNAYWGEPTDKICPDCEGLLLKDKLNKIKCSNRECGYKE
jgi:DNA topoisomerase-1